MFMPRIPKSRGPSVPQRRRTAGKSNRSNAMDPGSPERMVNGCLRSAETHASSRQRHLLVETARDRDRGIRLGARALEIEPAITQIDLVAPEQAHAFE